MLLHYTIDVLIWHGYTHPDTSLSQTIRSPPVVTTRRAIRPCRVDIQLHVTTQNSQRTHRLDIPGAPRHQVFPTTPLISVTAILIRASSATPFHFFKRNPVPACSTGTRNDITLAFRMDTVKITVDIGEGIDNRRTRVKNARYSKPMIWSSTRSAPTVTTSSSSSTFSFSSRRPRVIHIEDRGIGKSKSRSRSSMRNRCTRMYLFTLFANSSWL